MPLFFRQKQGLIRRLICKLLSLCMLHGKPWSVVDGAWIRRESLPDPAGQFAFSAHLAKLSVCVVRASVFGWWFYGRRWFSKTGVFFSRIETTVRPL